EEAARRAAEEEVARQAEAVRRAAADEAARRAAEEETARQTAEEDAAAQAAGEPEVEVVAAALVPDAEGEEPTAARDPEPSSELPIYRWFGGA
ncbi:MAG TPA: hypothetical protein VJ716_06440, partial [Gaiellaceae bacterium]|nr:hypothetical protein [Gaiellaceae bacterium]